MLLVIMFGVISLFSDLVYQAGRSLNGPFLAELGADAVLVGLIAGAAEFLGYALRLATGALVDRSKAYWGFTLAGYGLVAAVPLMALAGTWQVAALFIVIERVSKAVRAPAKDTLLSMAARRVGTGRGFAIHKLLDQTGAILGPLLMALVLSGTLGNTFQGVVSYQQAYLLLWIPLVFVLAAGFFGMTRVPDPEALEAELHADAAPSQATPAPEKLSRTFWVYSLFTLLVGVGFINFALLSFHAKTAGLLGDAAIPFWYAVVPAGQRLRRLRADAAHHRAPERRQRHRQEVHRRPVLRRDLWRAAGGVGDGELQAVSRRSPAADCGAGPAPRPAELDLAQTAPNQPPIRPPRVPQFARIGRAKLCVRA